MHHVVDHSGERLTMGGVHATPLRHGGFTAPLVGIVGISGPPVPAEGAR